MKGSKALTSVRKDAAIIGTADARFASAIEAIYDAAPDPDLWPKALQSIADCFDDVGALMMWRRDDGGFGTVVSPSLVAAQEDYEQNEWYLRDLPAQRNIELGIWLRKDAVTDLDGISDEEMQTHPFYRDFCARHGLRWRAAIGVSPDPHISVWIAIQRGPHKQPHSKAELAVAMRLARHVEKSLRLGIRLLDAELSRHGLGGALARVGIGVFALDALGRVVFSNPVAKCLVGEHIEIVGSRLRLGSRAERPAFDAAIARMLRGDPADLAIDDPKPLLIQRSAPARALASICFPSRNGRAPQNSSSPARAASYLSLTRNRTNRPTRR